MATRVGVAQATRDIHITTIQTSQSGPPSHGVVLGAVALLGGGLLASAYIVAGAMQGKRDPALRATSVASRSAAEDAPTAAAVAASQPADSAEHPLGVRRTTVAPLKATTTSGPSSCIESVGSGGGLVALSCQCRDGSRAQSQSEPLANHASQAAAAAWIRQHGLALSGEPWKCQ